MSPAEANPLTGKSLVVMNTSTDTTDLLKAWFLMQGMIVHTTFVPEFRTEAGDIHEYLRRTNPDILIFDCAIPYEANWCFLQQLRESGALDGIAVIVTTTNERVLTSLIGNEVDLPVHELIGKPYDLEQLTETVRRLLVKGSD